MRKTFGFILVVAALAFSSACKGHSGPTAPTDPVFPFAGTWTGSSHDSVNGDGQWKLVIDQTDPYSITGTWEYTYADVYLSRGAMKTLYGSLAASVNGASITTGSLIPAPAWSAYCPLVVKATVNGDQMPGSYAGVSYCSFSVGGQDITPRDGTFNLTKQQ